jgi:glutamine amidotransferase
MITIINYESGNIGSISSMLRKINISYQITENVLDIKEANKIILPGVGSYDSAILRLNEKNLFDIIKNKIFDNDTFVLGICLGMQLMCKGSEEGKESGFGYFKKTCKKFDHNNFDTKNTFMGWSNIIQKKKHSILNGISNENKYYFLHSFYYPICEYDTYSVSENGGKFSSIIIKNKTIGTQFHPERSHKFGMKILKNFSELK